MSDAPVNFLDLLAEPLSNFVDKPNLPGSKSFFGKILSMEAGASRDKKTPYYRFHVRLTDPGPDVTSAEMSALSAAGFNLGDFEVYYDFWLTRPSMPMFRGFIESLGFPTQNVDIFTLLKIDRQTGLPTAETQEIIRGRDVVAITSAPNDKGRVWSNLERLSGVKR